MDYGDCAVDGGKAIRSTWFKSRVEGTETFPALAICVAVLGFPAFDHVYPINFVAVLVLVEFACRLKSPAHVGSLESLPGITLGAVYVSLLMSEIRDVAVTGRSFI